MGLQQGSELPPALVLGQASCSVTMSGSHVDPTITGSWEAPAAQVPAQCKHRLLSFLSWCFWLCGRFRIASCGHSGCIQFWSHFHEARLSALVSIQASGSLDLRPTAARVSCQAPALSASATLHTRPPSVQAMKRALTQVPDPVSRHLLAGGFGASCPSRYSAKTEWRSSSSLPMTGHTYSSFPDRPAQQSWARWWWRRAMWRRTCGAWTCCRWCRRRQRRPTAAPPPPQLPTSACA